MIFPSPASGHPAAPLEALLQADFYGAPIVLEQVGSSEFLGFVIDVGDRATAGSLSTLLSGARSRSALATKYAHPARAVQMALDQLRSIYLSAGYKSADLQHLFHLPAIPTGKNVYVLIVVVFQCLTVWLALVGSVLFRSSSKPGLARLGCCARVFLFGFRGPLTLVFITELVWWFKTWAFSPTSESGRHARTHDSTSPPDDPERCGHDAAHPGDSESG